MFVQSTPPKFICDHCHKSIFDDNVTMFYRGRHFHMECFVHGVEKMKATLPDYKPPELKPVDLAPQQPEVRTAYGFPKGG
jgi:hypothetical protein